MALLEAAVEAVELDAFAKEIPDLVFHGTTAYGLLTHTIQRKYPDDVKKKGKEN